MINDNQSILTNSDTGESFEIPETGSLGLLALGYEGLMLWRAKKLEIQQQRKGEQND